MHVVLHRQCSAPAICVAWLDAVGRIGHMQINTCRVAPHQGTGLLGDSAIVPRSDPDRPPVPAGRRTADQPSSARDPATGGAESRVRKRTWAPRSEDARLRKRGNRSRRKRSRGRAKRSPRPREEPPPQTSGTVASDTRGWKGKIRH